MFVKIYQYDVKKKAFQKWKKNNDAARNIYKKYGGGNWQCLIQKKGNFINVIELNFYQSKTHFLSTAKKVDGDPKIHQLFEEFLQLIKNKHFTEGEFNSI